MYFVFKWISHNFNLLIPAEFYTDFCVLIYNRYSNLKEKGYYEYNALCCRQVSNRTVIKKEIPCSNFVRIPDKCPQQNHRMQDCIPEM